jgi:hypothetical protein
MRGVQFPGLLSHHCKERTGVNTYTERLASESELTLDLGEYHKTNLPTIFEAEGTLFLVFCLGSAVLG